MANRDPRHTEFGGGPGAIQRLPGGGDVPLTAGERARIQRMRGFRDLPTAVGPRIVESVDVTPAGPVKTTTVFAPDVAVLKELDDKTNRYARTSDTGEEQATQ